MPLNLEYTFNKERELWECMLTLERDGEVRVFSSAMRVDEPVHKVLWKLKRAIDYFNTGVVNEKEA